MKGCIPWNKGIKMHSKEYIKKLRKRMIGNTNPN